MNKYKIDNRENKELFVFPYGIDDLIVFLSVLKKYKEKNENSLIFLCVLAPVQPALKSPSYLKELAEEYEFIEGIFELENVVVTSDKGIHVDKKSIEKKVSAINKFYGFKKIDVIELSKRIIKDDYRYNPYYQFSTLLDIEHQFPKYVLPKVTKGCSGPWKKDYGIKKKENYIVVQLNSKFSSKKIEKKLLDMVYSKLKISKDTKIVEVGGKDIEGSIFVDPDDVRTTTLIDIIDGSMFVICNNSLVFNIAGIIDKKTYCIVNPKGQPLIRDYVFNFSKGNIKYFAVDETIEEWDRLRATAPFVQGNPIYNRKTMVKLSEINMYNPTQKINRLDKIHFIKKEEIIDKLKNKEEIERPTIWHRVDSGSLKSGGYMNTSKEIKFQLISGLPELLAYKELGYKEVPVTVTNTFKPFY